MWAEKPWTNEIVILTLHIHMIGGVDSYSKQKNVGGGIGRDLGLKYLAWAV